MLTRLCQTPLPLHTHLGILTLAFPQGELLVLQGVQSRRLQAAQSHPLLSFQTPSAPLNNAQQLLSSEISFQKARRKLMGKGMQD